MALFGQPDVDRLKEKGDVKGLIKALRYRKVWWVRRNAADALSELQAQDAVDPLIDSFRTDSAAGYTRNTALCAGSAAWALLHIADPRGVEVVFLEGEPSFRREAAEVLVQLGDARGQEYLDAESQTELTKEANKAAKEAEAERAQAEWEEAKKAARARAADELTPFRAKLEEIVGAPVRFDFLYYGQRGAARMFDDDRHGVFRSVPRDAFDTSPWDLLLTDLNGRIPVAEAILGDYFGRSQAPEVVASFAEEIVDRLEDPQFAVDLEKQVFSLSPWEIERWAKKHLDEIRCANGIRPSEISRAYEQR